MSRRREADNLSRLWCSAGADIHNGLGQFQLLNYTFQGYVTPQGHLRMSAGYGQMVDGQIDNQGVYTAQGVGACAYDATWRRSS